MKHGTLGAYQYHRCRCDQCRTATTVYSKKARARRFAATQAGGEPPSHGYSGYVNYGCRCDLCTAANTAYCLIRQRARRHVVKLIDQESALR